MKNHFPMKKSIVIILAAALALTGCNNAAKKAAREAEAEQERLDSISAAAAEKEMERREAEAVLTAETLPDEPVFDIVTNMGTIKVKLYMQTPKHRDNFEKLALSGYYDSTLFHRVIKDFMIQGGDPYTRDSAKVNFYGQGGPDYTIPAEFVQEYRHKKGALAAARRGDAANPMKESSGSQFYIVQSPENCVHLDGEYTVFGETVAGLSVIDKIASVKTNRMGLPQKEVRILTINPDPELNKQAK